MPARFPPPPNWGRFREDSHPALYYQTMLGDSVRMARYRAAIEAAVRPGDVVADLGTGLGVLAMMAAKAGAERVYAVEIRSGVLWLAEKLIAANGLQDRIVLLEGEASSIELPEPVDLVVNELIGTFGSDDGIAENVRGFADRNLREGGRVLPERLRTFLVPVEYDHEQRGVFAADIAGLDLRVANSFAVPPRPVLAPVRRRAKELAPPHCLEDLRFGRGMPERELHHPLDFEIQQAGTLQGFVGWFDATLWGEVSIESYPAYPDCHWENWNWPVSPAVSVEPGQHLRGALQMKQEPLPYGWELDWKLD